MNTAIVVSPFCECGCGGIAPVATKTRIERGIVKGQPSRFISGHNSRGLTRSESTRKIIGLSKQGDKNPQWKGDNVGYRSLHEWVNSNRLKAGACEECGKKGKTDFANLSGRYKRDINDYAELCRSCHVKFDNARRAD